MKDPVIVIDADKQTSSSMCDLLKAHQYDGVPSQSLASLEHLVESNHCHAVILDLDTVPVDNRYFRDLKRKCPDLFIIAVSGRPIHPELKESLAAHIYACVCKPVDPDELTYLVKSIFCNVTTSEVSPAHNESNAIY